MSKEKLVSIRDYAKLCGVSITAIRKRHDKNILKIISHAGMDVVDSVKYPPQKRLSVGRPLNSVRLARLS